MRATNAVTRTRKPKTRQRIHAAMLPRPATTSSPAAERKSGRFGRASDPAGLFSGRERGRGHPGTVRSVSRKTTGHNGQGRQLGWLAGIRVEVCAGMVVLAAIPAHTSPVAGDRGRNRGQADGQLVVTYWVASRLGAGSMSYPLLATSGVGATTAACPLGDSMEHPRGRIGQPLPAFRPPTPGVSHQHLVHQQPGGIYVAGRRGRLSPELFRGHVHRVAGNGERGDTAVPGQSEIGQICVRLFAALLVKQHVGRLDVSVNDAVDMRRMQGIGHLRGNMPGHCRREGGAAVPTRRSSPTPMTARVSTCAATTASGSTDTSPRSRVGPAASAGCSTRRSPPPEGSAAETSPLCVLHLPTHSKFAIWKMPEGPSGPSDVCFCTTRRLQFSGVCSESLARNSSRRFTCAHGER
jgi:hypothetical protein